MTLKLIKSVEVKQCDGDVKKPWYTGMDFLSDGRLVVVDNMNWKVYVMDENLQKLGMYKFSGYGYDVAVVSKEEVAVTGGPYEVIEFLHISKTNHITLTRTITTTALWCDSICLMNDTTFFRSIKSVEVKQCDGDGNETLYSGMEFLSDGRLVVVDHRNWKLYVMDENLQKLGMYKFSGYRCDVAVVSGEEVAVTVGRYKVI